MPSCVAASSALPRPTSGTPRRRCWALVAVLLAGCASGSPTRPHPGATACAVVTEPRVLAGVRALVVRPARTAPDTPVLVAWHGLGAPDSPAALAELVGPLPGVVAVYPELPLTHARLPPGGTPALLAAQADDYAGRLFFPIIRQAAAELPRLAAAARPPGRNTRPRIAVFGFSIGGAAALHAVSQRAVDAAAALNAPLSTAHAIAAFERQAGRPHPDTPATRMALVRYDFAGAPPGRSARPVLVLAGRDDGLYRPDGLVDHGGLRVVTLPGLSHQAPARDAAGHLQPYVPMLRAALRDWLGRAFPDVRQPDCPA